MIQPQSDSKTLVEALEGLAVHDHLCLIYDSREEQLAAVIPFMKIGLERGERCVYIADDNTVAAVTDAMREQGIDVDAAIDAGALSIITKREAYLKEDSFDPDWMIDFLKDAVAAAKADGFSALRATGEMTWMLGGEPGTERLIEYEAKLNYFFPEYDCLAICQYNRNRFDPDIIVNVIRMHPLVIYGTTICRNFYYVPPDEFLEAEKQKGVVETERLLASLVDREQADAALRDRELAYQTLAENLPGIVYRVFIRENNRMQLFNKTVKEITGYSADELEPGEVCSIDSLILEEDQKRIAVEVRYAIARERPFTVEYRIRHRDGRIRYLMEQGSPVNGPDGKPFFIDGIIFDVSDRVQAEMNLVESEERYRRIVETSLEGIWLLDSEANTSYVNAQMASMLGYEPDEMIGRPLYDFMDQQAATDAKELFERRKEGMEEKHEFRFRKKDGLKLWTLISTNPMTDDKGEFVGALGMVTDITRRKRSEEELIEAHRLLETIFDHTHMMVALLDPQLDFIRVNRAYAQADGKDPEFFTGKNHFDLFPNKENEAIFKRVVETGEPYFATAKPFTYEEHRERGVSYWDWSLVPIKGEGGAVVSLIFTLLNVTERVLSQEAIVQSEQKYHRLFEESKDGIIIVTPRGKIEDINPAGVEMLGYKTREELLALDSDYELFMNRSDRDFYLQTLKQQGFVKNYELDLKRRDGKPLVVSITASVVRDSNGRVTSFRGILRDLTAHRQLEEQLMQAQKMESIGRLAGGIAHDFNNFLTAIHGYIDLAAMELPEGSPASESLNEAKVSSDRAASLSRQLLLFGRRETLNLKPVDLKRVIADLLKMLGRLIGEQYEIRTDLAVDLRTINADVSHLEQVLMNLTVNARDAMPGGGIIAISAHNVVVEPGFVKARTEMRPREFVKLSVSDSGVGMDAEVKSHVFEPFFSTKGTGKGTGLGLSVVYGIITQHGGWIDVDSNPGMGTEFDIFFPALDVTPVQEKHEEVEIGEVAGNGERILLVEDDDDIRKMVIKSLVDHGYKVFDAADAESALKLYEREKGVIDLVFSDVVLPEHDGVWLVDQLKERDQELEVLLASGYSEAMDQQLLVEKGYRLMRKPYSLSEIMTVIHGMVSR